MIDLVRTLEKAITVSANKAWPVLQQLSRLGGEPKPFHPRWSDKPIPRGGQRSKPPLGWPRETDSLCRISTYGSKVLYRGHRHGERLRQRTIAEIQLPQAMIDVRAPQPARQA
ncbi:MAG TPA: hypothetical protein VL242_09745, partial [Sorangium sp.]|nr:hypothetical protein [Sorangium sp.]